MPYIVKLILDYVFGKLTELLGQFLAKLRRNKKIEDDVDENIDKLKKADSLEERQDAVKDLADNFKS